MKNPDQMSFYELRSEIRLFRRLLALVEICPICKGAGYLNPQAVGEDEFVAEQCQWCAERSELIGHSD